MKGLKTLAAIAITLCSVSVAQAGIFGDLFKSESAQSVIGSVASSAGLNKGNIVGSWSYSGTAVELESDNFLTKAAGSVATTQVEQKLNGYCEKVGIKPGTFAFTFTSDKTFTCSCSGRSLSGTYELSDDNKEITLSFKAISKFNLGKMKAKISLTNSHLLILFQADKLLDIVSAVATKTDISTLKTLNTLLEKYDGAQLGFDLVKK